MKKINFNNSSEKVPIGKIVCVGRNYAEHVKEMDAEIGEFPLIFMKPASTLIFNGENIIHPDHSNEMHHEVELVLLIGETIRNADDATAEKAIAGYAVGLDMTLRDLQRECKAKGIPWELAKSFDTCAVVSDFVSNSEYDFTGKENIILSVNNEIRQNSTLEHMLFNPVKIVKYLSSKFTLDKGDIIYTGTPEGVGKVNRGDIITASISGIGQLENEVI
ncbi:fumarylacetoacetate hydrolase family protein [Bacteroidota bacterium]